MRFPIPLFSLVFLLIAPAGAARAAVFSLSADTQIVGEIRHMRTRGDESLRDLAAQFGVDVQELERLNAGIDPYAPGPGIWITLPTEFVLPDGPRSGLVINVAERRLYYYVPSLLGRGAEVMTFPVVLDGRDWSRMLGTTRVGARLRDAGSSPVAVSHSQEAATEPAHDAPSATNLALRLDAAGCLLHAVDPYAESDAPKAPACLGLLPQDLELLYEEVREGTPVRIVEQAHKAGWRNGALYLESHASPRHEAARSITPAVRAIIRATGGRKPAIDWEAVRRVAERASGVPVRVSR